MNAIAIDNRPPIGIIIDPDAADLIAYWRDGTGQAYCMVVGGDGYLFAPNRRIQQLIEADQAHQRAKGHE
ncbi:MAG: hypothetical protein RJQ08_13560 [Salinisphaeraceae bacterium]